MEQGTVRQLPAFVFGALLACALSPPAARADTIYRTVDAQGHVVYSDHPVTPSSQKVTPDVEQPDPREVARQAREQAALVAEDTERTRKLTQEQQKAAADAEKQRAREQRCTSATNRYGQFKHGGRIYHYDAQGNRTYYTDEEIATEAAAAKKVMDEACGH